MKRIYYFDVLRSLAIISVLLMHSLSPYFRDINQTSWHTINLINAIVRYSVPLFVMISGALLLSKTSLQINTFIKKRFSRIVIPTLVWSLVYIYLYRNSTLDIHVLKQILNGPVYYHLWFMYMLISIYIAYPLLWGYTQKASKYNFIYIILAWFFITSIEPVLHKFYGVHIGIRQEVLTNYMGYFLLGYFLHKYDFTFKYSKIFYGMATLILIYLTAFGTEILSQTKLNLYFYSNAAPNVVLLSVTVFLFFKELPYHQMFTRFPKLDTAIIKLSYASMGIYLLHPIILDYIRHSSYFIHYSNSLGIQILVSWIGTLTISFLLIQIMSHIIFLKRIV